MSNTSAGVEFTPSRKVSLTAPGHKRKPLLPFNQKTGHLKIGPNRPTGKDRKYYAACDCGHKGWYTEDQLLQMIDGYSGCGQETCSAMTYHDKLWTSPDSLRIQHFTVLLLRPELLQSWWGGTMDDLYQTDSGEGYERLLTHLKEGGHAGVWLGRKDESKPFLEGNTLLTKRPDKVLRSFRGGRVEVEGTSFTMKELCGIANLTAEELLLKIYEYGTTDDLLYRLMEEQ